MPYVPARGCDVELNAWCDANCPHRAVHGPLLARLDRAHSDINLAWRCYARATLDADAKSYASGVEYCTRHFQLAEVLKRCIGTAPPVATVVDAGGKAHLTVEPPLPGSLRQPQQLQQQPMAAIRWPLTTKPAVGPPPHYEHIKKFMVLPQLFRLPRIEDCHPELREGASFWAVSLYTSSYMEKARRLVVSCEAWRVCCVPALMPEGALDGVAGDNREGSYALRHRLIASKPLFILSTLRLSPLPVAWLDVDLEFHAFPALFTPEGWAESPGPRDAILWNWQANVSMFHGRRLKMASGVAWFNKSAGAEGLLLAWSEAMAYEANVRAPDDQVLDLLVNDDGWIDRASYGWLPESYLRMMPRHKHIMPVIDHDRGAPVSGPGRNSPVKPVLPPHSSP
jgi:hypothetical protein